MAKSCLFPAKALPGLLNERGCKRVLEAASGIGLKALTFSRLGFEVSGIDVSAIAVELSMRLSRAVNIPAEFTGYHGRTLLENSGSFRCRV